MTLATPPEHKLAAIRYLTNHLSTYPMNETEKTKENDTTKQAFVFGVTAPSGPGPPHTQRHTKVVRTPLDE